jgi:hypothetical protein
MDGKELGRVTLVSNIQSVKQLISINVTEFGIVILDNDEQFLKQPIPIDNKLVVPKVTLVKFVHNRKTLSPSWFSNELDVQTNPVITVPTGVKTPTAILVTESGMVATVDPIPLSVTAVITLFSIV